MKHKENEPCLIDVYDYNTQGIKQIKGVITGIVSALDRPYRVNVKTDSGIQYNECAPEHIHRVN